MDLPRIMYDFEIKEEFNDLYPDLESSVNIIHDEALDCVKHESPRVLKEKQEIKLDSNDKIDSNECNFWATGDHKPANGRQIDDPDGREGDVLEKSTLIHKCTNLDDNHKRAQNHSHRINVDHDARDITNSDVNNSKASDTNVTSEDKIKVSGSIDNEFDFPTQTSLQHWNPKRKGTRDYCYFCRKLVLKFARHIIRHHAGEKMVQRIMSHPVRSKERKNEITLIRKMGNFLNSPQLMKPVRCTSTSMNLLPCTYCFGFYSSRTLRSHRKICKANKNPCITNTISEAQNFLVGHLKINPALRNRVFPRMKVDNISLTAKRDDLICAYGAMYLKSYDQKNVEIAVSRKMRELARLLIEMKRIDPEISQLLNALSPHKFDKIISATKIVADYDFEKGLYKSQAYTSSICSSLKQCCKIAYRRLKRTCDPILIAEVESDFRKMDELLVSQWKLHTSNKLITEKLSNKIGQKKKRKKLKRSLINKQKMRKLTSWTMEQKQVANQYFKPHILSQTTPMKRECDELLQKHKELFRNKNWLKIKLYVRNVYVKNRKLLRSKADHDTRTADSSVSLSMDDRIQDPSFDSKTNLDSSLDDRIQDPSFDSKANLISSTDTKVYDSDTEWRPKNVDLALNNFESSKMQSTNENKSKVSDTVDNEFDFPEKSSLEQWSPKRTTKDYCYFCQKLVLNFARHIIRHHAGEKMVQRIMSYPVNSKERKNEITSLRKMGNFLNSPQLMKPVKQSAINKNLVPCTYCFGFYSSRMLWRHRKRCNANDNPCISRTSSEAQNFLVSHLKINPNLRKRVFPRMRADDISLAAKRDELICAYGASYLKLHDDKHVENIVSSKMRSLARLLIEIKKIDPEVNQLSKALEPHRFDKIITATKIVADYDFEKDLYKSPAFASKICGSLKQCCEIAYRRKLKSTNDQQHIEEIQSDFRSMSALLVTQWKVHITITNKLVEENVCDKIEGAAKNKRKLVEGKKMRLLIPWTMDQKEIVNKYFREHIIMKKPPKKHECDDLIQRHSELFKNKHWLKIKVYVQNVYTKNKKKICIKPRGAAHDTTNLVKINLETPDMQLYDTDTKIPDTVLIPDTSYLISGAVEDTTKLDEMQLYGTDTEILDTVRIPDTVLIPDTVDASYPIPGGVEDTTKLAENNLKTTDMQFYDNDTEIPDTVLILSAVENTTNLAENNLETPDMRLYDKDTEIPNTVDTRYLIPGAVDEFDSPDRISLQRCGEPKRRQRSRDYCFFCKTLVLSFARHVIRNHADEEVVQRLLAHPVNSKQRKDELTALRKIGNYLNCSQSKKPVKQAVINKQLVPCTHCFGFYSSAMLRRHRKNCKPPNENSHVSRTSSEADNVLVNYLNIDSDLRKRVFPLMEADDISFTAKRDELICAYGANYLKLHDDKHVENIVSRKLRELAHLLIEIKKVDPEVNQLSTALEPRHFDKIVTATKILGNYNSDRDLYKSSVYSASISASLKQCCEISYNCRLKLKSDPKHIADAQYDFRTTTQLIVSQWKCDNFVSNDLDTNNVCDKIEKERSIIHTNKEQQQGKIKRGKKRVLIPWSLEQKEVVNEYFNQHILMKKPPKKHECENLIQMHKELLSNKDWLKIKVYVQNIYTKKTSRRREYFLTDKEIGAELERITAENDQNIEEDEADLADLDMSLTLATKTL